jgi:hypothetical protein
MKTINPCKIEIGNLSEYAAHYVTPREAVKDFIKIGDKSIQYVKSERDGNLLKSNMHPFVEAVHHAYSDHLPLNISPDMIWYLISSAAATHINLNAEQLRNNFVAHEGKKRIEVRRDDFVMNQNNPWNEVIDEFCQKVDENTKANVVDIIQANFSTTSKDARVVSQIVLMDAMQQYFEYYFSTLCGIPEIRIHGEKQDWEKLKAKTGQLMPLLPGLEIWSKTLNEILQQFINVFDEKIDEAFWNEIYKVSGGSGGPFISGWMLGLFPYLDKNEKNRYVWDSDWRSSLPKEGDFGFGDGLTTSSFMYHMNQVPFIWNYYGTEVKMLFVGGLVGTVYDQKDKSLTPTFGYAITEDKVEPGEKH